MKINDLLKLLILWMYIIVLNKNHGQTFSLTSDWFPIAIIKLPKCILELTAKWVFLVLIAWQSKSENSKIIWWIFLVVDYHDVLCENSV